MSGALLVSGFFLRRSAWSVEGAGWRSCDHLRDAPGCDLAHWLDQAAATLAGEERVILCGHSFGGYLAQCLAARLGERAAHLYLFSALVSEGGLEVFRHHLCLMLLIHEPWIPRIHGLRP